MKFLFGWEAEKGVYLRFFELIYCDGGCLS